MQSRNFSIALKAILAISTLTLLAMSTPANAGETILFSFNGTSDGRLPVSALVLDAAGNLYGATTIRGANGAGTVFELSPNGSGGWTETVLHSFGSTSGDGKTPSSGLILDASGNLYGVTSAGGASGVGTFYELSPDGSGGWTETVLYSFKKDGTDGTDPYGTLVRDAAGNLYGATQQGGTGAFGTVYELKLKSTGWSEKVLHSFSSNGIDGVVPGGGLILDASGNLYGETQSGGTFGWGTVFEMKPQAAGGWTEKVLHGFNFNGTDGVNPSGRLTLDTAGNLYGTTVGGGTHAVGTIFEMKPKAGVWTERVLYSFNNNFGDGQVPNGSMVFDTAGNLYGATGNGGSAGRGTLFELSPHTNGSWTETVLHSFGSTSGDGTGPWPPIIDALGILYGTTDGGGVSNSGTVYEFTR